MRAFRALADGESRNSFPDLLKRGMTEIGNTTPDDCHSILVSLSKTLKAHPQFLHPVRVAPFALTLLDRIFSCSEASFRTKAGAFGLISRLGVDWNIHIPVEQRDRVTALLRERFTRTCENSMENSVDPQTLGYCCETALYFALSSEELTGIVCNKIADELWSFPPLAIVQVGKYLSAVSMKDSYIWEAICERVICDAKLFSPQNLVALLEPLLHHSKSRHDLVDRICSALVGRTSHLRLSDCLSILESFGDLRIDFFESKMVKELFDALQRRITVVVATSTKNVPLIDRTRISDSLRNLSIPHSHSLLGFIPDRATSISGFIGH